MVRGDSAYGHSAVVRACQRAGARFSLVLVKNRSVTRAIAAIPEDAWTPVQYPGAVSDPDTGEWISDAEVAEVPTFTAFASTDQPVTARLIVRYRLHHAIVPRDDSHATRQSTTADGRFPRPASSEIPNKRHVRDQHLLWVHGEDPASGGRVHNRCWTDTLDKSAALQVQTWAAGQRVRLVESTTVMS